jgi:hypothetical protein
VFEELLQCLVIRHDGGGLDVLVRAVLPTTADSERDGCDAACGEETRVAAAVLVQETGALALIMRCPPQFFDLCAFMVGVPNSPPTPPDPVRGSSAVTMKDHRTWTRLAVRNVWDVLVRPGLCRWIEVVVMSQPVWTRRLTPDEGQCLRRRRPQQRCGSV